MSDVIWWIVVSFTAVLVLYILVPHLLYVWTKMISSGWSHGKEGIEDGREKGSGEKKVNGSTASGSP